MKTITIDVWSDIICPWCWIGDVRLQRALRGLAWRDDVVIRHRAFRLMPGQAPVPAMSVMKRKTNGDPALVRRMFAQVEAVARGEGLTFALERTVTGDTIDAHRMVKFAAEKGKDEVLLEALYRAHMSEGRSVFDHAVLREVAVEAGLAGDDVDVLLAGSAHLDAVEADEREFERLRAQGVPFYVLNGSRAIPGAQPIEAFLAILHDARRDQEATNQATATTCGLGGCA